MGIQGKGDATRSIRPPSDDQNPVPIMFPVVPAGTLFAFAVGLRGRATPALQAQAVAWLKAALAELGIGAKTSGGYGHFALEG